MTYPEVLDYLYSQLPMYQRQGAPAMKKDLGNTITLCEAFGNPEEKFKSIHVAGTNGKGSVCHLMASALQEAGYSVGLYTSPHLVDFRERIRINGEMIAEDSVLEFVKRYKELDLSITPSFFELTVAMAFTYFAAEQVDIAVIETGLGGRLDSTNVLLPELAVITGIGLDHQAMLGDTLVEIAGEKAGIIKPEVPVVIADGMGQEVEAVFRKKAQEQMAPQRYVGDYSIAAPKSALQGAFQKNNEQTAYFALTMLAEQGWQITKEDIATGFEEVIAHTHLRGRWEELKSSPKIITDGGHNEDGIRAVIQELEKHTTGKLHVVLGMVNDKDLTRILPLWAGLEAQFYYAKPDIPRGLESALLTEKAAQFGMKGSEHESVAGAISSAKQKAQSEDLIFIGGSLFVVAEAIAYFD